MNATVKLLLAPLIVLLSARSFFTLEPARRAHAYGWLSPEMGEHWKRLAGWRGKEEFDHAAKNVLTEWVRLDPQRAAKLFSFLLVLSVLGALVLSMVGR